MVRTGIFAALLLAATFSALAAVGSSSTDRQQSPVQPAATPAPDAATVEIHVDQHCHILPDPATVAPGMKPRLRRDLTVCHLESIFNSQHLEKTIVGNERHETWVTVAEQEYLLQNVTTGPVTFVVEQYVPKDWVVDSDPPPAKTEGNTAVFLEDARPGQIVRLHVGLRHAKPLKTTIIKGVPAPTPTAPAPASTLRGPASVPSAPAAPAVN